MIRYANYTLSRLPYELLLSAILMLVIWEVDPGNRHFGLVAALMFGLGFAVSIIRIWVMDHDNVALMARDRINELTAVIGEYMKSHVAVDIWQYQADLMKASHQLQPAIPTLHKGTLLYGALMAEEQAETFAGLVKILQPIVDEWALTFSVGGEEDEELAAAVTAMRHIIKDFDSMAGHMTSASLSIRSRLSFIDETFEHRLTVGEAIEILDGVTDVHVVSAGFSLATGLPGREAYEEVGSSNLSKANPVTGVIDKDASGKWIKGRDYRKPDLWRVLNDQQTEIERQWRRSAVTAAHGND